MARAKLLLYFNPTIHFLENPNRGIESLTQILDLAVMTNQLSSAPHLTNPKFEG